MFENTVHANKNSHIISGLEKNNHLIRQSNWDEYFSIWKKSMRLFIASLREITPERNIILVRSRFALNYKDDDGSVKKFSNQWRIMKDNLIWDRLEDSLLLEFSDIRTIDMRDCRLVADKQSPLGFSPSHYETEYYKQCLTKLNEITLEDLISEQM